MSINRVHRKKNNFSTILNEIAHRDDVSWEAKGVMWYLLTKPDGWIIRTNDLVKHSPKKSLHTIRRILTELEELGYVVRWMTQDPKGKYEWHTEIFESKEDAEEWIRENSNQIERAKRVTPGVKACPSMSSFFIHGSPIDGSAIDGKSADIVITDLSKNSIDQKLNKEKEYINAANQKNHDHPETPPEVCATYAGGLDDFQEEDNGRQLEILEEDSTGKRKDHTSSPGIKDQKVSISTVKPKPIKKGHAAETYETHNEFEFTYTDYGLIKLPEKGKFKLPSAIALKRLNLVLGIATGELALVEVENPDNPSDTSIWLKNVHDDEWIEEDELYHKHPVKALLNYAMKSKKKPNSFPYTMDDVNNWLEKLFYESIEDCQIAGERATTTYGSCLWLLETDLEFLDIPYEVEED